MASAKRIGCGAVLALVLGMLSVVFADEVQQANQINREMMDDVKEVLGGLQQVFELDDEDVSSSATKSCKCYALACSCCGRIVMKKMGIDQYGCFYVNSLQKNYTVSTKLIIGGRTLYSRQFSALKTPKVCIGVSFWKTFGSICTQFYNKKVTEQKFSGCIRLTGRIVYVPVSWVNIGCFKVNLTNTKEIEEAPQEQNFFDESSQDELEELPYDEVEDNVISMGEIEEAWAAGNNQL